MKIKICFLIPSMITRDMKKAKAKFYFICQNCGAQRPKWEGRCTDCGAWNSFVEELMTTPSKNENQWIKKPESKLVALDQGQLRESNEFRFQTGIKELDRVLGGGLFPGGFTLLGGSPGIGKSTLTLQMIGKLAEQNHKVLYVSAEESTDQSQSRARRLDIQSKNILLAAEGNLENIFKLFSKANPKILIIDSIQTVSMDELGSAPGSVSQVRECAGQLMTLAKTNNCCVFLIGHVTKEGHIAGPKVLEHMVDTVLSFEGDQSHQFRLLRSVKNRFGPAQELGVFSMSAKGLREVENPSEIFLEERGEKLVGSSIFPSIEGSRPLLCEIQALVTSTHLPVSRRTSLGFDIQRVHLLVAVLCKQLKFNLSQDDIFVNVVGGLRLTDTATDLAVVAALISSHKNKALEATACFFGEVGLTGEVRAVPFSDLRIKEGIKLGFKKFYLPASNKKRLEKNLFKQSVDFHWIKDIQQLFKKIITLDRYNRDLHLHRGQ